MSQYNKLARIYDYLMQGIDYEEWAEYIISLIKKHQGSKDRIIDLACGTGSTSLSLARKGLRVTGVDISPQMLEAARTKACSQGLKVNFVEQDMRELNLEEQADTVVVFQDGLNYMLREEDLRKVFTGVYNQLKPKGLFIFDINSVDKLPTCPQEVNWLDEEDMTLIWDSTYNWEEEIWEINLTGFLKGEGDYYEKFQEVHRERYYPRRIIKHYLEEAGFRMLSVYKAFTFKEGNDCHRRLYYVARREE
ncbi:MAG: class I SAM-dependent methyltransferase [Candidatus Syntrophonatronum acetioxidans]|uniref:Class I SAM-dependent methyltransferase n=1 Tax=Candidatus Syntrophonatronum acetioxidans TaxID=1795816 RepID=A0A424YDK5_9FIRM|nr:MAG: class I SAM-dependent methyltransferase [Candidatus Syntrophonatronum acetioxidans]